MQNFTDALTLPTGAIILIISIGGEIQTTQECFKKRYISWEEMYRLWCKDTAFFLLSALFYQKIQ